MRALQKLNFLGDMSPIRGGGQSLRNISIFHAFGNLHSFIDIPTGYLRKVYRSLQVRKFRRIYLPKSRIKKNHIMF